VRVLDSLSGEIAEATADGEVVYMQPIIAVKIRLGKYVFTGRMQNIPDIVMKRCHFSFPVFLKKPVSTVPNSHSQNVLNMEYGRCRT